MNRKPILKHFPAGSGGRPYGRQGTWDAIRALKKFTLSQLRIKAPQNPKATIRDYVNALLRGGYLERSAQLVPCASAGRPEYQYTLIRDIGVEAPRLRKDGTELPPTGQQNMWLALKILGAVTPAQLAAQASTAETAVPESTAAHYLRHLHCAGYLKLSNVDGVGRYSLVDNTGGLAPMITRAKLVFDPNEQRIRWHEGIGE